MDMTHPLGSGTLSTGSVVLMGRNENLQPKQRALWLKKDAVTMGLKEWPLKEYEDLFHY